MDRSIEEKLVAMLEAVGAPLTRPQVYVRISDEAEDEEHVAKILGRLVAEGTLVRRERPRFNTTPEFIYGTPNTIDVSVSPQVRKSIEAIPAVPRAPRVVAIAEAAKKVAPAPFHAKEVPMPNELTKFVEYLTPTRGWLAPGAIAAALKVHRITATKQLRQLVDDERIQTKGERRGLRFGHVDLDENDTRGSPTTPPARADAEAPKKKPRKPKRSRRLKVARERPAAAAPQLPVPLPEHRRAGPKPDEYINCAIEDSGTVAITNGEATIRLSPAKIGQVVQFLEHTQLIWKGPRP